MQTVANAPQAALPRPQPALHMAARTAQAAVRLVSRPQVRAPATATWA